VTPVRLKQTFCRDPAADVRGSLPGAMKRYQDVLHERSEFSEDFAKDFCIAFVPESQELIVQPRNAAPDCRAGQTPTRAAAIGAGLAIIRALVIIGFALRAC
jgi:hypothetical protein